MVQRAYASEYRSLCQLPPRIEKGRRPLTQFCPCWFARWLSIDNAKYRRYASHFFVFVSSPLAACQAPGERKWFVQNCRVLL